MIVLNMDYYGDYEMQIFLLYYIVVNMVSFIIYGLDKYKAVHGKWRIPEKILFGVALLGGGFGALFGMYFFHHKTRHWKFRIFIPAFLVFHLLIWVACCF